MTDHCDACTRGEHALCPVFTCSCEHGITTRGVCRECQPTDEESER